MSLFGASIAAEGHLEIVHQMFEMRVGTVHSGQVLIEIREHTWEDKSYLERIVNPVSQVVFLDEASDEILIEFLEPRYFKILNRDERPILGIRQQTVRHRNPVREFARKLAEPALGRSSSIQIAYTQVGFAENR